MKSWTRSMNASGVCPSHSPVRATAIRGSPTSAIAFWSPDRRAANSAFSLSPGSAATALFRTSTKKSNCTYVGRSHHSVPSLSRHATRRSTGTFAAASRKATRASRVAPGRQEGRRSGESAIGHLSSYAPEAEMAHPGVDHLRPAGRRPVTQAVAVRAQVGSALDRLATDAELWLRGVVALLEVTAARILRCAARGACGVRVRGRPPVVSPLPGVAGHVVEAETVGREAADRGRALEAALPRAPPGEVRPVPGVGH